MDIREILNRWSSWCAANKETVGWNRVSPGFHLIPSKRCHRPSCCDSDGILISSLIARLRQRSPSSHDIIYDYYIMGDTLSKIAVRQSRSIAHASKRLQQAEEEFASLIDFSKLEMR